MTAARLIEVFGNDAHLKYHLQLYLQMAGFNTKLLALWAKVNNGTPIEKIEDYKKIFYFFLSRQEPFGGVRSIFKNVASSYASSSILLSHL